MGYNDEYDREYHEKYNSERNYKDTEYEKKTNRVHRTENGKLIEYNEYEEKQSGCASVIVVFLCFSSILTYCLL